MGYGVNRARWGSINGSPGANWGKVHAILKNREAHSSSGSMFSGCGGFSVYQSRKVFKEGEHDNCFHCNKPLSVHTPAKKWCPKY
jgi:hypothetical protein